MFDIPAVSSRANERLMTNQEVKNSAVEMTSVVSAILIRVV